MLGRSCGRVAANTLGKYAKAVLPYCKFAAEHGYFSSVGMLEGAVGEFLPRVRDTDLRMLSGRMKHFFPFVGKSRISADLKGLERTHERRPRTPASRRIARALAHFLWSKLSYAQATGVITMFEGKLRTCEALKVKAADVIFASERVKQTTIRLGKTKNGREQAYVMEKDSLADTMLRILVRCSRNCQGPFV